MTENTFNPTAAAAESVEVGEVVSTVPASSAAPPRLPSPDARFRAENEPPSFFATFSAAWQDNTLTAAGLRFINREQQQLDTTFRWTDKEFEQLTADLPLETLDEFRGAVSYSHAQTIRQRILDSQERKATLADAGWTGATLSMVSAITDPVTLIAGALTGGTAWAGGIGRGAWAYRAGKGALAGAAFTGTEEALLNLEDPIRDYTDVMVASLYGAAFGGTINVAAPQLRNAYVKTSSRLEAQAMNRAGIPLSELGTDLAGTSPQRASKRLKQVDSPEAFGEVSSTHRALSETLETLSDAKLLGTSGVRAARQILSVVNPKLLARVSLSAADDIRNAVGESVENALGSTRQVGDGFQVNLRRSESGAKGKRQLGVLLHEIGHAAHKTLDPAAAKQFNSLVADLRDRNQLRQFVTAIAGRDVARDLSRLEADPAELFGEVFSKSLIARYGGDAVSDYSKRVGRQAEKYREGAGLDPKLLRGFDKIVDTAAGIDPAKLEFEPQLPQAPSQAYLDIEEATAAADEVLFDVASDTPDQLTGLERRLRFDLAADMLSSSVERIRGIGSYLLYNGVGDPDKVRIRSTEEAISQTSERIRVELYAKVNPAFESWARSQGSGLKAVSDVARADFFEQVGRVMHLEQLPEGIDANVATAATAMRRAINSALKHAVNSKVPGAKEAAKGLFNYRPRVASQSKRLNTTRRYGKKAIVDWFQGAILSASKKLNAADADDVRVARQMARGYVARLEKFRGEAAYRVNSGLAGTADELDEVLALFKDQGKMTDADIAKAKDILVNPEDGRPDIFKARMPLDEDYVQKTKDGEIAFHDLFETDAEKLAQYYIRSSVRESEFYSLRRRFADPKKDTRTTKALDDEGNVAGETSELVVPSWEELMGRIAADMQNLDPKTFKAEKARLDRLDDAGKILSGQIDESSGGHQAARLLMKSNFNRIAAAFGIAQIAEIPVAVASQGLGVMVRSIPEFRRILTNRAQTLVNNDDGVLSELIGMGIGAEGWTRPSRLMQDVAGDLEWDRQMLSTADKAEKLLDKGGRIVSIVGGLQPITNWTRVACANTLAHRIGMNALGEGRTIRLERLRDMGWDEAAADAIYEQFRKHAEFNGKKLVRMNLDEWDEDVASTFAYGVTQKTHAIIQQNHLGGQPKWFASSPVMKMLLQFRSFQLQAWTNQTLRGLKYWDMETFANFSLLAFGGGLSYAALVAVRASSQEDPAEYLAEHLTPQRMAMGAFARSGFSSIIPTVADTAGDMFLNFQFFSNTRTSGLRQNAIMGIPTVDLLAEKLPGAIGAVASPIRPDYNLSSEDVRNFRSLIPLQNLIGIDHTFRSIEGQLPKRSQKADAKNSLDALLNEE
ncbi:hypothetical protein [Algisphaera agarilytica]|uniref:Large polyvalent protein associated domain-containing protein n=1 Tax=Algisphaera agarilytica TaxID=1385975 RepID=A0A7X0LKE1_9BACT|nr:hypothetical protein [Algisphaera agarilytica]MBB6428853.1 hypothetical protein [Algisphaera agarilytica]